MFPNFQTLDAPPPPPPPPPLNVYYIYAIELYSLLNYQEGSRFELPEVLRKSILEKVEKEQDSSMVDVLVHSVPLIERIKKKEVERIKNFEEIARLLKTAQNEVQINYNIWLMR